MFPAGKSSTVSASRFVLRLPQSPMPLARRPAFGPAVSDTGEIVHDTSRKQLSFAAPKAEVSAAIWTASRPQSSTCLHSADREDSHRCWSRRWMIGCWRPPPDIGKQDVYSTGGAESSALAVSLRGLVSGEWSMTVTRPVDADAAGTGGGVGKRVATVGGVLALPCSAWGECELVWRGATIP